ncbi:MAG: bifunctional metallophosphatase/5'-nucleotidase [Candidatus Gastranaerophilales bacterium]|nr:bifunctional metallophosphatase/5'-nucleotidase [Candidatus Gastranaerophilales bacterium]
MQINFLGTKVNTIFYNDLHGSTVNIDAFLEAQQEYYKNHSKNANLTLSGGDVFVTTNPNNEIVAKKLCIQTDAIGLGNHDIEAGEYLANLIKKYALKGRMLASNLFFKKPSEMETQIAPSAIIEKNGERFGVIGVAPFDFRKLCFTNKENDFFEVAQLDETLEIVRKEVLKLQKEGINKIFVLAHSGQFDVEKTNLYEKIANISGVDVVFGGHDHIEVDTWSKTETNEPVKIVATGANGVNEYKENLNIYGILELEFDDNGVLIPEKSKTQFKELEERNYDDIYPIVATIKEPLQKGEILYGHSEVGNLVADSNLWYVNSRTDSKADFAFVNAGTIRASLSDTNVSIKDIEEVVPFTTQKLIKTTLTKKQVIDTLSWCAQSTTFKKVSPGVMQVANMTYTINPDLSITNVKVLNEDGSIKYDVDKLDDDFEFCVVYDDFLATGVAGLSDLIKDVENDKTIEIYDTTRQNALKEYLINGVIKDCKIPRITNLSSN